MIVNENGLLGDIKNFFVKDKGIKTFFASLRGPSAEEIAAAKAAAEAAAVAKAEAAAAAEAADVVRQAEMKGLANEMASRILEDAMAMAEKDQKEAQEAQEAAAAAAAASTLASSPRPQVGTVLAKALGASSKLTSLTFSPRGGKTPQGPVAAAPGVATPVAATLIVASPPVSPSPSLLPVSSSDPRSREIAQDLARSVASFDPPTAARSRQMTFYKAPRAKMGVRFKEGKRGAILIDEIAPGSPLAGFVSKRGTNSSPSTERHATECTIISTASFATFVGTGSFAHFVHSREFF